MFSECKKNNDICLVFFHLLVIRSLYEIRRIHVNHILFEHLPAQFASSSPAGQSWYPSHLAESEIHVTPSLHLLLPEGQLNAEEKNTSLIIFNCSVSIDNMQ